MIMQLEVASDRGSIRDNKGYLQFKPFPQPPPLSRTSPHTGLVIRDIPWGIPRTQPHLTEFRMQYASILFNPFFKHTIAFKWFPSHILQPDCSIYNEGTSS